MFYIFAALIAVAFVVSAIMVPVARRLAFRIGLVDHPGERKIHVKVTPYGGGIAIFISFLLIISLSYAAALWRESLPFVQNLAEPFSVYLGGLTTPVALTRLGAIMGGGLIIFLLGLIDDWKGLPPKLKLAVQIICALILWVGGVRITFFIESNIVSIIFTVLWVVGITNAMNLLDNMDGLSAGVALISAAFFFVVALQAQQFFVAAMIAVFIGSVAGFLPFNFNPASIFMGDAGSLFLGYMLSAMSMSATYYREGGAVLSAVMPVIVLAIPIFDTASVMIIRLKNHKPLMVGDKNHFSHRLVRLGMTRREAVLTIYVLCATLGISSATLRQMDAWGASAAFLHTAGILGVIALLEVAAHRRPEVK